MSVRHLMNGASIPNWAKLVVLGVTLGIQVMVVWHGQRDAVNRLIEAQTEQIRAQAAQVEVVRMQTMADHRADSLQMVEVRNQIVDLRRAQDRMREQINFELGRISEKTGFIARKVD